MGRARESTNQAASARSGGGGIAAVSTRPHLTATRTPISPPARNLLLSCVCILAINLLSISAGAARDSNADLDMGPTPTRTSGCALWSTPEYAARTAPQDSRERDLLTRDKRAAHRETSIGEHTVAWTGTDSRIESREGG